MLLKTCRPRQRRVACTRRFGSGNSREARKCAVILSGAIASLREAITESKDLHTSTGVSRGVSTDADESVAKSAGRDQLIGILRLRLWFAKRTRSCAQDDTSNTEPESKRGRIRPGRERPCWFP